MPEISGSRLAELTGKQWRTVKARLEAAGIRPLRRERNADLFDSASALAAIYAADAVPAGDFDTQRERLAAAQAEKVEHDNALRRKELADVNETEREVQGMVGNARANLLNMGPKLGPQLVNIGDPHVIAAAIRAEVYSALSELAAYDPARGRPGCDGAEDQSDVGAAADADGERVVRPRKATQQRKQRRARALED